MVPLFVLCCVRTLFEPGKAGEDRQALLDDLLAIVTDPQIPDEDVGALIRDESIGWERLRAAIAQAKPRLPRDHGHLAALDSSYGYLRKFTPSVLSAVRFAGGTSSTEAVGTTTRRILPPGRQIRRSVSCAGGAD